MCCARASSHTMKGKMPTVRAAWNRPGSGLTSVAQSAQTITQVRIATARATSEKHHQMTANDFESGRVIAGGFGKWHAVVRIRGHTNPKAVGHDAVIAISVGAAIIGGDQRQQFALIIEA